MTAVDDPLDDPMVDSPPVDDRPGAGGNRRWLWLLVLLATAVGAVAVLGTGFGRDPGVVESALEGKPAPPLQGATLEGGTFDLGEHRGQVVVVNVWASWCVPCRREHPLLQEAAAHYAASDVQFVGINTQDTADDARAFLSEMGATGYPHVLDPAGRWAVEWGTFGVPETFVVDQGGRLRAKRIGELTAAWLPETIEPLLQEP